jgi:hypothetical protein
LKSIYRKSEYLLFNCFANNFLEKENLKEGKLRFIAVVAITLVLFSSIAALNSIQSNAQQPQTSTEAFSVSINPPGTIQLATNHVQFFTAIGSNDTVIATYDWRVVGLEKEIVNSTNYQLITDENAAYFKFIDKSIEFCWLTVVAKTTTTVCNATATIQQITNQPIPTQQASNSTPIPQNTPNSQNQNSTNTIKAVSSVSYIVQPTDNGQYEVVRGSDGNTVPQYTSKSANTTLNKAIASGGTVAIKSGDYSGAELIVPANVNIISEPDVKGIQYTSIANGARIDEPTFNAAFGSYVQGDYTVAADASCIAFKQVSYLAFKSDKSIYWQSTNASFVMISALQAMNDGDSLIVASLLTLDSTILIEKSVTIEFANFGDTNNPNILFTGSGNVFEINSPLIAKYAGREITLRNMRIDGKGNGENGIEVDGIVSLYVYDVKICNMGGKGFYSNARGVFLRGTTLTVSTNQKEGFHMISGQIDIQLIFAVGNGGTNYYNAVFKDVGPGFVGRLVASGGAGKQSNYGAYFVSGNFGLTIGTLHLELVNNAPLTIGQNESICGLQNSVIETIFLYNSPYGSYTGYPVTINNANSLSIGSIQERNVNSTYTYSHSLLIFNIRALVIQTLDVQKDVFRANYANDNQLRILIGYKTEYP